MTGPDPLASAAFIVAAFVLAGLAQAAWLRTGFSGRLAVPLDGGLTFRGRRVFGDNKTFRGFVVMVPAVGAAFLVLALLLAASPAGPSSGPWPLSPGQYGLLGLCAGFGFMLGELPNSFLKRQLGIPPGGAPADSRGRAICFLLDRLDSIAGMLLALAPIVPVPWQTWAYVLLVGPAIHWSFSLLLFLLGVKARPA